LLSYLTLHRDRTVPPSELLEHLYGDDDARDANALEAVIARLRRKIGPGLIHTRRGFGYDLGAPG
ncbi:winged helix-turn-helix domain-containing protein, partial [Klebsiella pneumoniae]|nr:winged helix-turn-helix domain-containing protein [Klebsiella pneumoniae]